MGITAAVAIGVAGAAAGSAKDKETQTGASASTNQVIVTPASKEEQAASATAFKASQDLEKRLAALESSPALANLERLMQEMGSVPTAERLQQSQQMAETMFAPRREQLQQQLTQQSQQYAARAAQLGRSSADPILAAKLAQEQIRQTSALSAEQNAFATSEAFNAPARAFQNQLGALTGLSGQAIQNRQAVYSLGSDFANTQQQFRLATATRTGSENYSGEKLSGGGFKGAMAGFNTGVGTGMSMAGKK